MTSSIKSWVASSPPVEWVIEWSTNNFRELLMASIRQGPVPQHIAFVMDGNRRYAKSKKQEAIEGHSAGFEALARTLEICYKIGVKVVTVYAFSIENFKRPKYEVEALMEMAKTRLCQFAEHGELLERYGARLQFLGKRDILRADVLAAIDNAIDMTKGNTRAILNICAPYTSREEMAKSVRDTVIQYCQPLRPRLKRHFSETHIARNLRAQRLSSTGEKPDIQLPTTQMEHITPEDTLEDEYVYKPTLPETHQAYDNILRLVSQLLADAADEHTLSADDNVISGATNSILYHLKDNSITEQDKQAEISDVVGSDVSLDNLKQLQQLADKLVDYAASDEQTLASESTTLNTSGGDQFTQQTQPTVKYPDVERINADALTANTYTGTHTPPLDILVRTSGVERLSDFMLWQCHQSTAISFVDCFWPDFGLKHLVPIILEWQWRNRKDSVQRSYRKEANGFRTASSSSSDWRKLD